MEEIPNRGHDPRDLDRGVTVIQDTDACPTQQEQSNDNWMITKDRQGHGQVLHLGSQCIVTLPLLMRRYLAYAAQFKGGRVHFRSQFQRSTFAPLILDHHRG